MLDVARRILKSKPLIDLAIMKPQEISKIKGVGKSRAAIITASLEIATRIFKNDTTIKITTPEDVLKVVGDIRNKKKEHFVAIYLDARNQLIATETISIGTLNKSIVHPRDVFAPAIKYNAASIIVAHNHPSGDPEPSNEDIMITEKLVNAGRILDIDFFDHIVVTSKSYISLNKQGVVLK